MVFTRMSSRFLFLRTKESSALITFLKQRFNTEPVSLENALHKASEDSSIVFITSADSKSTDPYKALAIMYVPFGSSDILMAIINNKLSGLIEKAQLGPGFLIMRIPEKGDSIIELIKSEYGGILTTFKDGLSIGDSSSTLMAFSTKAINNYMLVKKTPYPYLLINQPVNFMQRNIRRDAIKYITGSLKDKEWYEYRINIYDSYGRYKQHLERLMLIINELELGFALGERWTKDHALVLYSVTAYQVRIYSLLEPESMKLTMVGLEFDSKGMRFVDLDLYFRSRKVEYSSLAMESKKKERSVLAMEMRQKILDGLNIKARADLLQIESGLEKD